MDIKKAWKHLVACSTHRGSCICLCNQTDNVRAHADRIYNCIELLSNRRHNVPSLGEDIRHRKATLGMIINHPWDIYRCLVQDYDYCARFRCVENLALVNAFNMSFELYFPLLPTTQGFPSDDRRKHPCQLPA